MAFTLPALKSRLRSCGAMLIVPLLACACHNTAPDRLHQGLASDAPPPSTDAAHRDQQHMYLQLIRDMQRQGAWYASLAHIDAFRLENGDSDELELLQAEALRATHQAAAALPIYRKLIHTREAAAAWHGIGMIESGSHHREAALEALDKACIQAPLNADYLADLGYERLLSGSIQAAGNPLSKAAELMPSNHRIIANLALFQLLSGQADAAERLMQGAGLSPQARAAVQQLSRDIRSSTPALQAPAHATAASSPTRQADTPETRQNPIPESMLDRFGAATDSR